MQFERVWNHEKKKNWKIYSLNNFCRRRWYRIAHESFTQYCSLFTDYKALQPEGIQADVYTFLFVGPREGKSNNAQHVCRP